MFFGGCHTKTWGCSSKTWQPYPSSYITFNLLSKRMESWSFQKTVEVFGVIKNWLNSTLVGKKFSPQMKSLSHLLQRLSDLKQNGTKKTPYSGTVFNTLWHGVVRVVASGSSKNHLLTGWDYGQQLDSHGQPHPSIQWFLKWYLKLPLATKWKGMEDCARKWYVFLCTILFEVTWAFCNMWWLFASHGSAI